MAIYLKTMATLNPEIDGLLCGFQWNTTALTFSFPKDASDYGLNYGNGELTHDFAGLLPLQQQAVRSILAEYAAVAPLTFQEVQGSSSGGADLRFARSTSPGTAWTYTPSAANEAGDVWLSSRTSAYNAPTRGSYAWLTVQHETGLSLGFKDAFQDITTPAGAHFAPQPADHDALAYTVESYHSYVGSSTAAGYVNGAWDYPQTLMLDDIRAIQSLYGANFNRAGSDAVFAWDPATGEMSINGVGQGAPGSNIIFSTVWTAGAHATYDLSAYTTALSIDLRPGAWSTFSTSQVAHLDRLSDDTHLAPGNVANAYFVTDGSHNNLVTGAIGGSGADLIIGNDADNLLQGGAGNDTLDGGAGQDTAVYSGRAGDYAWSEDAGGVWTIRDLRAGSPDGVDRLSNIERLRFADGEVAIDAPSAPHATSSAYAAILYHAPDAAAQASTAAAPSSDGLAAIIKAAVGATSVATAVYAFFTGATPNEGGMAYLLDPNGSNPNNLNSAGFQALSIDQRYINLSVSLGGSSAAASFQGEFAGLSLTDAYLQAYNTIFGTPTTAGAAALALAGTVVSAGTAESRSDYFTQVGGGSDLGAKAALVGWLISSAIQSDTGVLARANDAFLQDLALDPHFGVDLVGASHTAAAGLG